MAQPIYKTKNGQFSAAVFENPKGKSISLQKGYTDKEGVWQNQTITLFPRNVDQIIEVLQEAKKNCESTDTPTEEAAPKKEGSASPSSETLPGGDELIIENKEELEKLFGDELEEDEEEISDRSEMEEFIEEEEMSALEIWNRCDDIKEVI